MQRQSATPRAHTAEPAPGSFRAATGEEADLFDVDHYPVQAVCRICHAPIQAESFLRVFTHKE